MHSTLESDVTLKSHHSLSRQLSMPRTTKSKASKAAPASSTMTVYLYDADPVTHEDSQKAFPGSHLLPSGRKGTWASIESSLVAALEKKSTFHEDLFAILPSSFTSLTALGQESLQNLLDDNSGRDLYFFNLNPVDEAIFPNPWSRLFLDVKDIQPLIISVLKAVGEGQTQANHLREAAEFHSFPAAIGTGRFWTSYFDFVNQTLDEVAKSTTPSTRKLLNKPVESLSDHYSKEVYRGLLGRHLFPFFLRREGTNLKAMKLLIPQREQTLNTHVRTLRQLREASVRSNAPWLGAAWLNYRNLYLLGVNGKAWCNKNLPLISPRISPVSLPK